MKNILKEKNILSLAGNMVFAGFGFVSFILLTRLLSPEMFAEWVLFITIATFTDLLRFGLTRSALVRFASGANAEEQDEYSASSVLLNFSLVLAIGIVCYSVLQFDSDMHSGYKLFFVYYPLLSFANLPWNNALSIMQANQQFGKILFTRTLNAGVFTASLLYFFIFEGLNVEMAIYLSIGTNALSSAYTFFDKSDGLLHIRKASFEKIKTLFHYGKYSIGTIVGSSLLRSADSIIIGMSLALGPVAVAIYAIPLKIVEFFEIPLRSFTATAFPKMSQASRTGDKKGLLTLFYRYTGLTTLLYVPFSLIIWFNAFWILPFFSGEAYIQHYDTMYAIYTIFCLYGLLLPLDRFTGVFLDSVNKPQLNLIKVIIMASLNIIGDLIAVFVYESLVAVSIATILFTLSGIVAGWFWVNKESPIHYSRLFGEAIMFLKMRTSGKSS